MKTILPKIKFKNFYEKWNRKKLQSIAPLRGGFAFKSEEFQDSGIPIVRISNIKFDGTIGGEFEYYSKINPDENFVLKGRAILLAMSGATTGKIAMLDSEEEYYQNQRVGYFQNTGAVAYDFLSSVLQTKEFTNQLNSVLVAGAQPNISSKEIDSFVFYIPESLDEQSAIGSLFRTLDDLLASYKDNLANYQSLKATMLSKMFPKAGQTVPEIRLDGFKGEWEINKLNKYLTVSKKKNTKKQFSKEDVLSVSGEVGIVNQIQFQGRSFAGVSVEMYSIVETGNIVYTKSPLKANPYGIIKTNYGIPGIVSTLYAVYLPNENLFPGFVERYFENDLRLNSYLKPLVNKGAKNDMKVSDENALLGNVIFPKLEEQIAISDYFTNLDRFIQSHKDKISQLETLKKKLLQDMFI